MFIVVAIVIFGLFVSLSYTLFGKTLQPQVVSLFENATEMTLNDLNKGKSNFKVDWTPRGATNITEDTIKKYRGNTIFDVYFNGLGDTNTFTNDLVLRLSEQDLTKDNIGDKVTISFYAKSSVPTEYKYRLGGKIYNYDDIRVSKISTSWQYFEETFTIDKSNGDDSPAAITSWSTNESIVSLSQYKVVLKIKGDK